MNQIHPKSQTTQILYQPPTKAEMKPKSFIKDTIHNIVMALVVVSIMSGLTTACFYAADKEAEYQQNQGVQHERNINSK